MVSSSLRCLPGMIRLFCDNFLMSTDATLALPAGDRPLTGTIRGGKEGRQKGRRERERERERERFVMSKFSVYYLPYLDLGVAG